MRSVPQPIEAPTWQPPAIHAGRRRALIGLSGLIMAAMHVKRAWAQTPGSCVLTPEAGEGPFYIDPRLVRSDLSTERPGAPLELSMQVVRAGDCARLTGARVDVWHADAIGLYSGYARQGGVGGVSTDVAVGKSYLRGTQITDEDGNVRFRTIFPSWYGGRTPHVHFKVFLGGNEVIASQIFFPDEVNDEVFKQWEPYRQHVSKRQTFNHNDPIRAGVHSSVTRAGRLFAAKATLVVAPGSPRRNRVR
jgi:protocatechuate 3,4-dioxygenase beta subunit